MRRLRDELKASGWVPMYNVSWERRPGLDHAHNDAHNDACNIHKRIEKTSYRSSGWGRPARLYPVEYVRPEFVLLWNASCISDAEIEMCKTLEITDTRFQALMVIASLAGATLNTP